MQVGKVDKKEKNKSRLTHKRDLQGWFFVSPLVIGIVFIFIWVLFDSIRFSFGTMKLGQTNFDIVFAGWANYHEALFVNPNFLRSVWESTRSLATNIPVTIIFSLFIAVLLNQKMPGRAFFRAMFFVPVILSVGFVEKAQLGDIMLNQLSSGTAQVSQEAQSSVFAGINLEVYLQNLSFSPTIINFVVALVNQITSIINQSGVQILIFLSGLQSISPSIYESASIEGATQWESFWKITLPMITPMILVNAVYTVIDYLTRSTNPIMTMINTTAFTDIKYGVAAAMSWIYFVIIGIALVIVFLILGLITRRSRQQ